MPTTNHELKHFGLGENWLSKKEAKVAQNGTILPNLVTLGKGQKLEYFK
jgi:hypothetical protein